MPGGGLGHTKGEGGGGSKTKERVDESTGLPWTLVDSVHCGEETSLRRCRGGSECYPRFQGGHQVFWDVLDVGR